MDPPLTPIQLTRVISVEVNFIQERHLVVINYVQGIAPRPGKEFATKCNYIIMKTSYETQLSINNE